MMSSLSRVVSPIRSVAILVALAVASTTTACAAQRAGTPLMMASVGDDAAVTLAFRALLDDVIGDSADKICLSVMTGGSADGDPSPGVMRALRGRGETTVLPRSVCAEDERNFGNPRGLLRLRDVARADQETLIAHADAVGDHTAHYECTIPYPGSAVMHSHCRITSRD